MKKNAKDTVSIAQQLFHCLPMHTTLMAARSLRGSRTWTILPVRPRERGANVGWHRCHLASVSMPSELFRVKVIELIPAEGNTV